VRSDCGPPIRLSHRHFLAPFREPANNSRSHRFRFVKEQWKMPVFFGVLPGRETPVAGPSLVVRGMAITQSTVR